MNNSSYVTNDGLPCIHVVLKNGMGRVVDKNREFVIDTGATQTGMDVSNPEEKGFKYKGILTAETGGGTDEFFIYTGAIFEFNVKENGRLKKTMCKSPIAIFPANIMGVDMMKKLKLRLIFEPKNNMSVLEKL